MGFRRGRPSCWSKRSPKADPYAPDAELITIETGLPPAGTPLPVGFLAEVAATG
jgi:hypothetical protein